MPINRYVFGMTDIPITQRTVNGMDDRTSLTAYLPPPLARMLAAVSDEEWQGVQEVRIRKGSAVVLSQASRQRALDVSVTERELQEIFWNLCSRAVHAHQAELSQGFITTRDGFRVGVAGTAVIKDDTVASYRDITSLCIRVARRVRGCAAPLVPYVYDGSQTHSLLLCGAPGTGKTTLLRDLAVQLARRCRVTVVDERLELCGDDLRDCDVIRGCPKAQAMRQAVRTLSPDVMIADELGAEPEWEQVGQSAFCGVSVVASAHLCDPHDLRMRPSAERLLRGNGFEYVVSLPPRARSSDAAVIQKAVDYLEGNGDRGNRVFLRGAGTVGGVGTEKEGTRVEGVGDTARASAWHAYVYGTADTNDPGVHVQRGLGCAPVVDVL